jgi:hypothetical protein
MVKKASSRSNSRASSRSNNKTKANAADDYTFLNSNDIIAHYNRLNQIVNDTQYPWDLRENIKDNDFIPSYKNVVLYYKDPSKLMAPPIKKAPSGKRHGGAQNGLASIIAGAVNVFYM